MGFHPGGAGRAGPPDRLGSHRPALPQVHRGAGNHGPADPPRRELGVREFGMRKAECGMRVVCRQCKALAPFLGFPSSRAGGFSDLPAGELPPPAVRRCSAASAGVSPLVSREATAPSRKSASKRPQGLLPDAGLEELLEPEKSPVPALLRSAENPVHLPAGGGAP